MPSRDIRLEPPVGTINRKKQYALTVWGMHKGDGDSEREKIKENSFMLKKISFHLTYKYLCTNIATIFQTCFNSKANL